MTKQEKRQLKRKEKREQVKVQKLWSKLDPNRSAFQGKHLLICFSGFSLYLFMFGLITCNKQEKEQEKPIVSQESQQVDIPNCSDYYSHLDKQKHTGQVCRFDCECAGKCTAGKCEPYPSPNATQPIDKPKESECGKPWHLPASCKPANQLQKKTNEIVREVPF